MQRHRWESLNSAWAEFIVALFRDLRPLGHSLNIDPAGALTVEIQEQEYPHTTSCLVGHMSNVKDSQGNVLKTPGPGCGRYKDENAKNRSTFAMIALRLDGNRSGPMDLADYMKYIEAAYGWRITSFLPV